MAGGEGRTTTIETEKIVRRREQEERERETTEMRKNPRVSGGEKNKSKPTRNEAVGTRVQTNSERGNTTLKHEIGSYGAKKVGTIGRLKKNRATWPPCLRPL